MSTLKQFILVLILSVFANRLIAQDSLKTYRSTPKDKQEYGFSLGADFSGNLLVLPFLPYASYDIHKMVSIGASPIFALSTDQKFIFPYLNYGLGVFGKLYISEHFYGQLENDLTHVKYTNNPSISLKRRWVNEVLIGAGYRKDMSFGYAYFSGFYIANYSKIRSGNLRPFLIRAGIGVRLNSPLLRAN
jgi:hypothetical protein